MHILQVTLGYYPAGAWGGPAKVVRQVSRELAQRGHQVTVYCSNLLDKRRRMGRETREGRVEGVRVVYFRAWNMPWWPGTLGPMWLPDLPRWIGEEIGGFEVMHVHGYRNLMHLPLTAAARRTRTPFVVQPHGTMQLGVNSLRVKRLYDRTLGGWELGGMRALIALQDSERQQALRMGVDGGLIEVIPNGLAEREEEGGGGPGFRERYGIGGQERVALFLGRINKKKGTDMLVEAFRRMELPGTRLVIAGPDDGQLAEVKASIARYGLGERVTLTGLLDEAEAMAAMRAADLFVLPCRTDTFPTTIMEACLAETPMVITESCESAYLVKGRASEVVPFEAEALARAMEGLLKDRQRYEAYKRNCRAIFEEAFSLKAAVDRLEGLYERVRACRIL